MFLEIGDVHEEGLMDLRRNDKFASQFKSGVKVSLALLCKNGTLCLLVSCASNKSKNCDDLLTFTTSVMMTEHSFTMAIIRSDFQCCICFLYESFCGCNSIQSFGLQETTASAATGFLCTILKKWNVHKINCISWLVGVFFFLFFFTRTAGISVEQRVFLFSLHSSPTMAGQRVCPCGEQSFLREYWWKVYLHTLSHQAPLCP